MSQSGVVKEVTLETSENNVYRGIRFYEILEKFLPSEFIDKALAEYAKNDAAHLEDHAIALVTKAETIMDRFPELREDYRVILTGALLHEEVPR